MLATPSYIAKAEVTATTTASTIATTNKSNNTVASLEKPASTLSVTNPETGKRADLTVKTGESKNQVLDQKPVVSKSVEKEPIETSAPVETGDKPNDSSVQSKSLKQTTKPKDISKDIFKPTENNVISESRIKEDKDVSHSEHESTDSVIIDAATGKEKVVKKADSGNGWVVVDSGKTLNIVGKLDEGNGRDHERWGGHTQEITTININNALTAPKDSSYLFANMTNLTKVNNLKNLNTVEVENAEGMFKNDSKLEHLDLSAHSFRPAKNISHMFENDSKLKTIKFGSSAFKNIVDGSYAFANDKSLTDFILIDPSIPRTYELSATNSWTAEYATDLRSMFKNDSSLKKLNLYTWSFKKADTGNSALGQGMFDGTNLETIVLNGSLKFSEGTALTSKNGIKWVSDKDDKGNHSFYGVPSIDNKGNARGGIGGLYNGINNVIGTNDKGDKTDKLTYNATGKAEVDKQINNLITIPTDHGDITVNVAGNYGKPDNEVKIPDTWSFDGHDYERESSSPSSVNVEFGLTEGQANLGREIVFVEKKDEPDNPTETPAPTEPDNPTETPAPTEPGNPTETPAPT
ncbi:BspA family leucine-rich repeat surface protein, partial [Companilactobacillus zhachilii]|uniref:BspA family leucine-rich repeat surface protein n=1 Tax=Companilactobacillus zhachilii TaxID=2304606 RepID=UPI00192479D9